MRMSPAGSKLISLEVAGGRTERKVLEISDYADSPRNCIFEILDFGPGVMRDSYNLTQNSGCRLSIIIFATPQDRECAI